MTAKNRGHLVTAQEHMAQAKAHLRNFEFRVAMEWYESAASLVEYVVKHEPVTEDHAPPSGGHEAW